MKKEWIVLGAILVVMAGCKSIPYADEKWRKPGASKVEIRKALLGCGAPNPSSYEVGCLRRDWNKLASIDLCMLNSGFSYRRDPINWCREQPEERLAVCSDRRLESPYCKRRTDRAYCIKMASDPASCERFNFNSPPPECLP